MLGCGSEQQLPHHTGLCQWCTDRHNCPMERAQLEKLTAPRLFDSEHDIDDPVFDGDELIWCQLYG